MFTLPRIQIVPLHQVPGRDAAVEAKVPKPLALIVDDERVIADTLSIILAKSGFATMTAYDGEGALELARGSSPNLLLSDVMMGPGMDGTELAMEMARAYPKCKVLLFSGHAATCDLLSRAREAGHDFTLLSKPLHPADLLARLSATFSLSAA